MGVRFEWQAADEQGRWESIARVQKGIALGRVPWQACGTVMVALLLASALASLLIWRRYAAAQERIAFHIQSTIDLEARALAEGDLALWLAQQDPMAPGWREEQAARAKAGTLAADSLHVARVEVRGDVAWVEVESERPPSRRARCYRRTEWGWVHTAPRASFWRDPVEQTYGSVTVHCHERDQDQVEPLAHAVAQAYEQACEQLHCPSAQELQVYFAPESARVDAPRAAPGTLWLASPWLSGVGKYGKPDQAALEQATYWGRWAAAAQSVGTPELDPLQKALAAEYAAWSGGELVWTAPLLGRVIERHGPEVLPQLFHSLAQGPTTSAFLAEWLDLSAREETFAYLKVILQIEQEALYYGQKDTFLLMQVRDRWWQEQQGLAFDRQQREVSTRLWLETAIEHAESSGACARVIWREYATGRGAEDRRQVSYYRRQEGGWVHMWPASDFPLTTESDYWSRSSELTDPPSAELERGR
jgi:hypothetical protein